ncbi:MAG: tRNA pseudouridine synthase A [Acidimicrobiales bacterium]
MRLFDPDPGAGPAAGASLGAGAGAGALGGDPGPGLAPPPAPSSTVRLRLVVAYDGARFRGFAPQPGVRTVAGELARAMEKVLHHRVELVCAGRTDAGVHARGQVVHADVDASVSCDAMKRSLNGMLAPEVVVRSASVAAAGFDARRSAISRRYRYLVLESEVPDPLLARVSWQVPGPLDLRAMAQAADAFVGEHDFRAFCRRPPGTSAADPILRRVIDARWSEVGLPAGAGDPLEGVEGLADARATDVLPRLPDRPRLLRFEVVAQSFCHQMVRSMVGLLVEVGRGRRKAADVAWLLAAASRPSGLPVAPAGGLCLVSVDYGS